MDERSTDVFILNMVTDPDEYSCTSNSAHTNAIASVAPNSAANAAAELGHTGDIYASFTQNAESLGEGTQGLPTQADAVMLSYPLFVQYHRRCASHYTTNASRYEL